MSVEADPFQERFASLDDFVRHRQGRRVLRKILVANNGAEAAPPSPATR